MSKKLPRYISSKPKLSRAPLERVITTHTSTKRSMPKRLDLRYNNVLLFKSAYVILDFSNGDVYLYLAKVCIPRYGTNLNKSGSYVTKCL